MPRAREKGELRKRYVRALLEVSATVIEDAA
jgi:hypothetical protein